MELKLTGKRALVTGGSRGIGAAIGAALAAEGCDVALTHLHDGDAAAETGRRIEASGRRVLLFDCDVAGVAGAEEVVAGVVDGLGGLDILVCNAGITADRMIWKMEEEQWDRVIDVNLKGTWNYCRAAARVFKEKGSGKIVNVASINGLRGKLGQTNYAASKGGMIALTKTLARELGRYGVNVNALAPGMVKTDILDGLPEAVRRAAEQESVLGRIAEPEDVASAAVFLCSRAARHITGQVLQIDGGQYI